ncbi:MAG: 3-oxoacyl-[acyl-carrier-protein] reductase [Eubacteriales bacterium]|nr:3-oxoacyl-[acyl-carrier-protein] reductase [Eubacteriales bacterium]
MNKQVILITGASRGIGRAIAKKLASPESILYLHYGRSAESAEKLQKELAASGVETHLLQADLAKAEEIAKLIPTILEAHGRIDVLVNNAGVTVDKLLMRMSDEDYEEVYRVNQLAAFRLMRDVARPMLKQRSGKIINISSIVGLKGNAGQLNYAATKAALIGMTKSMALELGSRGITVNAVAPGFIETEMTAVLPAEIQEKIREEIPLGRFGKVEEVANLVAFLASPAADYITAQTISVDGGLNR